MIGIMKVNSLKILDINKPKIIFLLMSNIISTDFGCWEWTGRKRSGYGTLQIPCDKKSYWAHRLSYACFTGPIKANFVIDHICRNRACINPKHLKMVTHKENCLAIYRREKRDRIHSLPFDK